MNKFKVLLTSVLVVAGCAKKVTNVYTLPPDVVLNGMYCEVFDSKSVDRSNGLFRILANAEPKFTKVINQFDTGDTSSYNGYPKFTTEEQDMVGLEDYAMDCVGYLDVPLSGEYKFYFFSDDGSKLAIHDDIVVDNDGLHSPKEKTATVSLYRGLNKINVLYFQGPHHQVALDLDWSSGKFSRTQLTEEFLTVTY